MKNLNFKKFIGLCAVLALPTYTFADNDVQEVNIKAGKHISRVSYAYNPSTNHAGSYSDINVINNNSGKVTIRITCTLDPILAIDSSNFHQIFDTIYLGNVSIQNPLNNNLPVYYYFQGDLYADKEKLKKPVAFARFDDSKVTYANTPNWGKSYKWEFGIPKESTLTLITASGIEVEGESNNLYCLHGAGGTNNNTLVVDAGKC